MRTISDEKLLFMEVVSSVVVFFIIWWTVLFVVLPFGIKPDPNPEKGCEVGAPLKAQIGKKLIITTLISIPLWFLAKYLIAQNIIGV
jgi:predicted secreted protein